MPAHDRGHTCEVREGGRPHNALRVDTHVVVQEQDVVGPVLQGLVHAAREAARATEVGLVHDTQVLAQGLLSVREKRVVLDLPVPLVHDDDLTKHARQGLGGA